MKIYVGIVLLGLLLLSGCVSDQAYDDLDNALTDCKNTVNTLRNQKCPDCPECICLEEETEIEKETIETVEDVPTTCPYTCSEDRVCISTKNDAGQITNWQCVRKAFSSLLGLHELWNGSRIYGTDANASWHL